MSERKMSMMCTENVSNSVLQSDHKGPQVVCYESPENYSGGYCEERIGCFQNTGIGWWKESGVAECLRTPCGGDSMKANIVAIRL